jgi:hypothetical protein
LFHITCLNRTKADHLTISWWYLSNHSNITHKQKHTNVGQQCIHIWLKILEKSIQNYGIYSAVDVTHYDPTAFNFYTETSNPFQFSPTQKWIRSEGSDNVPHDTNPAVNISCFPDIYCKFHYTQGIASDFISVLQYVTVVVVLCFKWYVPY